MKKKFGAVFCLMLLAALLAVPFSAVAVSAEPELFYYTERIPNVTVTGEVTVSFHAKNTTGQEVAATAYVAVYDSTKLFDVGIENWSIPSGADVGNILGSVAVCVPESEGDCQIRSFLWHADTMEPILSEDPSHEEITQEPTEEPIPVKRLLIGHNVMNAATLSTGYVQKNTGETVETATSWRTSAFLPVEPGQAIVSENSRKEVAAIRYLAAYDENKEVIPESGLSRSSDQIGSMYVVPDGVAFVRLSVSTNQIKSVDAGGWMVELKRPEEAIIPMEQWDDRAEPPEEEGFPNDGGNTMQIERSTVPARGCIQLGAFPQNIKKGLTVTFSAEFDQFTRLTVGKGCNHPWGDWLEIDNTSVTWKGLGANRDGRAKPHGLTIEKDIRVTLQIGSGRDSVCTCTVKSGDEESTLEFAWLGEQNGMPFAYGAQEMTNAVLSATVTDMNCPIWLFGDSYFGMSDDRVIGQLFGLGYGENSLVDGLPGQNSVGAYADLERLLKLGGMPQTLVWMLGMNDTVKGYQETVEKLSYLAEEYHFELILMTVPIVPDKVNPGLIDEYVISSGYRYVDACGAVGADENGNWYEGYLSADNVHPTASGARAIAAQLVSDVPEIAVE